VIQRGRTEEAEAEFEKLLGGSHVKFAMAELSKSDRGDDIDTVRLSELLYGRHFRGRYDTFLVYFFSFSPVATAAIAIAYSSVLYPFWAFQKCFVIHTFLLQLFLLGPPYLLYNSYLV
jgi:hypothetical protein